MISGFLTRRRVSAGSVSSYYLVRLGDVLHTACPPSRPLAHKSSGLLLGLSPGLWESGLVSRSWKFLKALDAIHARRSPTMSPFGKFRSLLSYTCCTVVKVAMLSVECRMCLYVDEVGD